MATDASGSDGASSHLFGVFDGDARGPRPYEAGCLTWHSHEGGWTPSKPGTWYDSSIWKEADVFQAQLSSESVSGAEEWIAKIGKGGQLYSLELSGHGELLPPQHTDESPWTDDCFVTTQYGSKNMDRDPALHEMGMNFLQNGCYIKTHMDPILQKPFYEPLLAERFDHVEGSYSLINLRFTSQPSLHRSDAMMYTKFRRLGGGVIEITYYVYNFGQYSLDDLTFPWGGVRTSKMPDHIQGKTDGTFRNHGSHQFAGLCSKDFGWSATAKDATDMSSLAFAIVHGVDHYKKQARYEYIKQPFRSRVCDTDPRRDFTIMATWTPKSIVLPGEGFFFRTYLVMGSLDHVSRTATKLVGEVDYGKLDFGVDTAAKVPLFAVIKSGQTILTRSAPSDHSIPVAKSFAVPVNGSLPLLLLREVDSGTYVLTTDPHCVCSKSKFQNPFTEGHPKHLRYQNRVVYRPYDGRTEWVSLLGYVLPTDPSKLSEQFSRLSSILGDEILFVPGERLSASELMIWNDANVDADTCDGSPTERLVRDPICESIAWQGIAHIETIAPFARGANSGGIQYRKVLGPSWLRVEEDGNVSGTPGPTDEGLNTFSIRAVDSNGVVDVFTHRILVESNIDVVIERNSPGNETWTFPTIPGPSSDDYADVSHGRVKLSVTTDNPPKVADVGTLVNGSGQKTNEDPWNSVFFDARGPNRILMDLGLSQRVLQINTYSWHVNSRIDQKYVLYYCGEGLGDVPPPSSSAVRSADLVAGGWTKLVAVSADPLERKDTQIGVSIRSRHRGSDAVLVETRYLVWDLLNSYTCFGEFDVYTDSEPGKALPAEKSQQCPTEAPSPEYVADESKQN